MSQKIPRPVRYDDLFEAACEAAIARSGDFNSGPQSRIALCYFIHVLVNMEEFQEYARQILLNKSHTWSLLEVSQ